MSEGRLVRALAADGAIRVIAVDVRGIAARMTAAHALTPGGARLAAECLAATALMSAYIKGEERLTLQIQGTRPAMSYMGEIDGFGAIRARLSPSDAAALRVDGLMFAIKSDGAREVYRGVTEIRDQTLQDALAGHLGDSTQVDVVLRIDADWESGRLVLAGGLVVERLPEEDDRASMSAEAFRERYASIAEAPLADLLTELALGSIGGATATMIEDRPLAWRCRCSLAKVEGTLAALGADELAAMIAEGGASATCHFCNTAWSVPPDRLAALLERVAQA